MKGPLDMGGHKIYEVHAPTNDKDAANKKYVDDNSSSSVFKDGSTTTNQLDIRRVLSSIGIFEDVTFHSGAYSQDVTSASPASAVVNKSSLQNGGLVGLDSLVPTIKGLLSTLQEQKFDADISLLVLKGTVASHTVEPRDSSLVNNVVLRKVGHDTQLTMHFKKDLEHRIYSYEFDISSDHTSGFDIYMYGECGGSGFHAQTMYRYWSSSEYNNGKDFNDRKIFLKNALNVSLNKGDGPNSTTLFDNLQLTNDQRSGKNNGAKYKGTKIIVVKDGEYTFSTSADKRTRSAVSDFKTILEKAKIQHGKTAAAQVEEQLEEATFEDVSSIISQVDEQLSERLEKLQDEVLEIRRGGLTKAEVDALIGVLSFDKTQKMTPEEQIKFLTVAEIPHWKEKLEEAKKQDADSVRTNR